MIERKIIIGLITSTEYLQQIQSSWDSKLLSSQAAQKLSHWVWEYFNKYGKAPNNDIEDIFYSKVQQGGIADDVAQDIEDILNGLSEEYEEEGVNVDYLRDQSAKYFLERSLVVLSENTQALIDRGKVEEAEKLVLEYTPPKGADNNTIDLSSPESLPRVKKAFRNVHENLISYRKHLGTFWNDQLVRGRFVAFMGSEKRGKTFWLMDFGMIGCKQGRKVAFFQAGDMTEDDQLRRIGVYLARKSDLKKYCEKMWEPVADCVRNQTNTCDKEERTCDFGVFEGKTVKEIKNEITVDDLIEAYSEEPDYTPCTYCDLYEKTSLGTPWIKPIEATEPLSPDEAEKVIQDFFIKYKRQFRLATYANGTLFTTEIMSQLDVWEKQDGFVPDIVIVDYADLLESKVSEFRHKQNAIWKDLRRLSQERYCLVVTATQADAKSYEKGTLRLANFSEDKRKYAHVTAMYGLNQDTEDREKNIGIMRINQLIIREGSFSNSHEVTVLQNLKRGRPHIASYW